MAAERKAAPNEQAAEERAGGGSRRQLSRESRHLAARRLAGVSPLHRSRLAHFAVELCGAIDDKRGAKRRPGRVLITSAGRFRSYKIGKAASLFSVDSDARRAKLSSRCIIIYSFNSPTGPQGCA